MTKTINIEDELKWLEWLNSSDEKTWKSQVQTRIRHFNRELRGEKLK